MIWILWKGQPYFLREAFIARAWWDPVDRSAVLGLVAAYLDAGPGDLAGLVVERIEDGSILVRPADVPRSRLPDFSRALQLFHGGKWGHA